MIMSLIINAAMQRDGVTILWSLVFDFHSKFILAIVIQGKDKFGKGGLYQVILKRVELPVVPRDECQSKLRETRLGRHFILDHSFICAGKPSSEHQ